MFRRFAVFILFCGLSFAKPVIGTDGIASAASYLPSGFPNSGVAQGSIFLVFGTGLGPASLVQATSFPLPTVLPATSGTSMKITVSGTTTDAIMLYTVAGQVAAVLPSKTPTGDGTLTLTYNGETSDPAPIHVIKSTFSAFTLSQSGIGQVIIQIYPSYAINTMLESAKPNDVVILWGTGLGPVTGDETQPPAQVDMTKQLNVQVYVGGKAVTPLYAGRSGFAGLDQINFKVPSGVTYGCSAPISVRANSVTGTFGNMSIADNGGTCADPPGVGATGQVLDKLDAGKNLNVGLLLLSRLGVNLPALGGATIYQDNGSAAFYGFSPMGFVGSRGLSAFSSFGSCQLYQCRGASCLPQLLPLGGVTALDAGQFVTVTPPSGSNLAPVQMPVTGPGQYSKLLGGGSLGGPPPYLNPGTFTISGTGKSGANAVAAFSTTLTLGPSPLTVTSPTASGGGQVVIPRSSDLTVKWSGGDPSSYVSIVGTSSTNAPSKASDPQQVTATFTCSTKASDGQLTVPSWLLSNVPASGGITQLGITIPSGFLLVGEYTAFQTATPPQGLDLLITAGAVLQGENVQFQ
jgi:uncharacterized protein (TIGR03437 family)